LPGKVAEFLARSGLAAHKENEMKRALLVALTLAVMTASSFAGVISGKMTWVTGTLNAALTVSAAAQAVDVKVGTTSTSYTCLVPGTPGTSCAVGTPVTILVSGSSPFIGTYAAGSDLVALPVISGVGSAASARRLISLTTAGATEKDIAFLDPYSTFNNVGLLVPPCTAGSIDMLGGVTLSMLVGLPSYSFTEPTSTVATVGSVAFPAGSLSPNSVVGQFNGNGILAITGSSATSTNVPVAAVFEVGTLTECTFATLSFSSATPPIAE
jgi:hypothetical protein